MANIEKEDKYVERWLNGKKSATLRGYNQTLKLYLAFTKKTPEELIMEKWEDSQKRPDQQTDIAEKRVKEFYKYLTETYTDRSGKHLATYSAKVYCVGALAGFYRANKVALNLKSNEFEGVAKPENARINMSPEQIEKLAYYAPTTRDKAIIWCMFQSGSDVSTVLSWNWGHIEQEILNPPLGAVMIRNLLRKKTRGKAKKRYNTLIYKIAITHLKQYLEEQHGKDYYEKLKGKFDYPLFLGRSGSRHDSLYVQKMLREIAPRSDIANSQFFHADLNPVGSHSLRASFEQRMALAKANPFFIKYLMGTVLGVDDSYFGGEEGLRKAYVKLAEETLEPKGLTPDVEAKLGKQEGEVKELGSLVVELRGQIKQLTDAFEWAKKEILDLEEEIADLKEIPKG